MKAGRRVHRGLAGVQLASMLACLLVTAPLLAAQLTLTWTDNASNEAGSRIERRLNPSGIYAEIATVGTNVTTFVDSTVTAGQGYCYRVRAYNVSGSSGYSNEACRTAAAPPVTLTVAKIGTGTVTSTSPSNAVNCGADCTHSGASGTQVTLAAAPGSGFIFSGWGGGGCSGLGSCTVILSANTTVTAIFTVPGSGAPSPMIITGAGFGGGPHVRVLDGITGASLAEFFPYDPAFTGGVHVAAGDVTGDGVADLVTAPGPGGGPHVQVFDGAALRAGFVVVVYSFFAYDPGFTGGVFVAAADVNGDGRADIITSVGPGGGPHVRVFDGTTGAPLAGPLGSFFAYDPRFTGGVFVAAADLTDDDRADLVIGPGPGGGPHVRVLDAATGASRAEFFAYDPAFTGGVHVAVGDVTGDGVPDVITASGPGGGPHVQVFDGAALRVGSRVVVHSFFAYDPSFTGGVFVAAADVNGDGRADIITSVGPGGGPHVQVFDGATGATLATPLGSFFAYSPGFTGGVFVAGAP